ncbi:non-canonical purine NTP pyrophosphatase [Vibrio owensii]|uniref:non-canonical purine NTP pyrophosphatase n=1 Tax=Vibrio owensii TaxID=696485 RepID=UPI003CC64F75
MIKVDVAKEWGREVIFYYLWEGKNSAEQFCEDVVIPALRGSDEIIEFSFDNCMTGLTHQQTSIIAFYLVRNASFDPEELKRRVRFKEESFDSINEEFADAVQEAKMPYKKLVTSNYSKLIEFNQIAAHTSFTMELGVDVREVKADSKTVAIYKSVEVGPNTIVEDTILEVDGIEIVDIRYKLDEINRLQKEVPAKWITTLAQNDGEEISLFVGSIEGVLKPIDSVPEGAFGFDPNFYPKGSKLSLHELACNGDKFLFSARANAIKNLEAGKDQAKRTIDSIPPWKGEYQTEEAKDD